MPLIINLYMQQLNFLIYKFELHVTMMRGVGLHNTQTVWFRLCCIVACASQYNLSFTLSGTEFG
jgi:hypothetical protein